MKFNILIERQGHIILFCIISSLIAFSTIVNYPLVDTFHEGEYVGFLWHMRAYYNGLAEFPLLIHGGVDYIPSIVASLIYGDDCVIVGTRLINTIIIWIGWIFFLDLCCLFTAKTSQRTAWAIVAVVTFLFLVPPYGSKAVPFSWAFINARDFFLVLSVWNFAKYLTSTSRTVAFSYLIFGSFSSTVAIFWNYADGIMAIAFFGIMLIGVVLNKRVFDALLLVLSALLCLAFLEYSNIIGSAIKNIDNIAYWIKYSAEIWSTPLKLSSIFISHFLLILFCIGMVSVAFSQRLSCREDNRRLVFFTLGLIVIQVLLLKTNSNRLGLPLRGIWPSILLMLYFGQRFYILPPVLFPIKICSRTYSHIAYKISLLCLLVFLVSLFPLKHGFLRYGSFFKNLIHPENDVRIVDAEMNRLSNVLQDLDIKCVMGWTNEGVIALMTKKRFCTNFPYSVYASRDKESELLNQLIKESPKAIVFDSSSWSMNIDNRPMASRLPAINQFILKNYPTKQSVGSYVIAIK